MVFGGFLAVFDEAIDESGSVDDFGVQDAFSSFECAPVTVFVVSGDGWESDKSVLFVDAVGGAIARLKDFVNGVCHVAEGSVLGDEVADGNNEWPTIRKKIPGCSTGLCHLVYPVSVGNRGVIGGIALEFQGLVVDGLRSFEVYDESLGVDDFGGVDGEGIRVGAGLCGDGDRAFAVLEVFEGTGAGVDLVDMDDLGAGRGEVDALEALVGRGGCQGDGVPLGEPEFLEFLFGAVDADAVAVDCPGEVLGLAVFGDVEGEFHGKDSLPWRG